MSDPGKAVFLSYASQDAEAARRICEALRAAGVAVWFDAEGGLEHGDEWDAKIRKQIKECVLFLPLISANTQAREEGYFRIEWELAAERAMGIASGVAFILPVIIDGTREPDALVPDRFRKVQWTRLPGGEVPPDVLARYVKLWSHRTGLLKHRGGAQPPSADGSAAAAAAMPAGRRRLRRAGLAAVALAVLGVAGFFGFRAYYDRQVARAQADLGMIPEARKESRVAVARFDNRTGDPALELPGQLIADQVRRRLPLLDWVKDAVAIPAGDRPEPEATPEQLRALAAKSGADALITGHYYRQGGRLQFFGRVVDLKEARTFAELAPIEGDAADPAAAVTETAERLLGAALHVDDARTGREDVSKTADLAVPRRFDAIELRRREGASEGDFSRYREAYAMDPKGSLGALMTLALVHYVREEYPQCEAVLDEVAAAGLHRLPPFQRETARWLRASLHGERREALEALEQLCRWRPNAPYWKRRRIFSRLDDLKPRAVLAEFASVPPGSPAERLPSLWVARIAAYYHLRDFPALLAAADRLRALTGENDYTLWCPLFVAAMEGNHARVMQLLDRYDSVKPVDYFKYNLYVVVLSVLRERGRMDTPEFAAVVRRGDEWFASRPPAVAAKREHRFALAEFAYVAGRYAEARKMAERYDAETPGDVRIRGLIATCAVRLGDTKTAAEIGEWLRQLDPKYRFGYHLFAQAKIAAVSGRRDEALRLLREATGQFAHEIEDFSREALPFGPDFESLKDDPGFRALYEPQG